MKAPFVKYPLCISSAQNSVIINKHTSIINSIRTACFTSERKLARRWSGKPSLRPSSVIFIFPDEFIRRENQVYLSWQFFVCCAPGLFTLLYFIALRLYLKDRKSVEIIPSCLNGKLICGNFWNGIKRTNVVYAGETRSLGRCEQ